MAYHSIEVQRGGVNHNAYHSLESVRKLLEFLVVPIYQ